VSWDTYMIVILRTEDGSKWKSDVVYELFLVFICFHFWKIVVIAATLSIMYFPDQRATRISARCSAQSHHTPP
jgi:hypothetical protein